MPFKWQLKLWYGDYPKETWMDKYIEDRINKMFEPNATGSPATRNANLAQELQDIGPAIVDIAFAVLMQREQADTLFVNVEAYGEPLDYLIPALCKHCDSRHDSKLAELLRWRTFRDDRKPDLMRLIIKRLREIGTADVAAIVIERVDVLFAPRLDKQELTHCKKLEKLQASYDQLQEDQEGKLDDYERKLKDKLEKYQEELLSELALRQKKIDDEVASNSKVVAEIEKEKDDLIGSLRKLQGTFAMDPENVQIQQ